MKSLFLSLMFVCSAVSAQNLPSILPSDAIGLSAIEEAMVTEVQHDTIMCPMVMGSTCKSGLITTVTLQFRLNGCMDQLSQVTYDVMKGNDQRHKILVSAHNIHTKSSLVALCARIIPMSDEVHITLPGHIPAGKISVETLKPAEGADVVLPLSPGRHIQLDLASPAFVVDVRKTNAETGVRTVIDLRMGYACGNRVSHVNVRTRPMLNNKMVVYVSAVEGVLAPGSIRCMAMPFENFSVSVPGKYSKHDVTVINLVKSAGHNRTISLE